MAASGDDHVAGSVLGWCWTPHGERQGNVCAHLYVSMVSTFYLSVSTDLPW